MTAIEPTAVRQAGAIAFRKREHRDLEILLVRPSNGHREWLFPKGHIEQDESETDAALRELREEAGISGRLIGAVDQVARFPSNQEQVAVRFYVIEALTEEEPAESREHTWLPLTLAAEALTHDHNRLLLSEALPIIDGCLSVEGDNTFRQFMLAELDHTTDSFNKSEEDGERRAKFFLTLVAGAGAVLAYLLGDASHYQPNKVSWPLILVLVALLLLGHFVTLRVITRNKRSDEYKGHLRRMRRWFTPNSSDPRRAWVAFDPFAKAKGNDRGLSYWGPKTGGWLEVLLLVNAILAGVLVGALVDTDSWPLEAAVSAAGGLLAWLLLVANANRIAAR